MMASGLVLGLGLCLALQAAPEATVFIPQTRATLAWTHSIEKIRWEEDLQVEPDVPSARGLDESSGIPARALERSAADGKPRLRVVAARIRGSGAGMEPPEGAVLRDGWYHYAPTLPARHEVALARSPYVPDFELCLGGRCEPMSHWLAGDGGVTLLSACLGPMEPQRSKTLR